MSFEKCSEEEKNKVYVLKFPESCLSCFAFCDVDFPNALCNISNDLIDCDIVDERDEKCPLELISAQKKTLK